MFGTLPLSCLLCAQTPNSICRRHRPHEVNTDLIGLRVKDKDVTCFVTIAWFKIAWFKNVPGQRGNLFCSNRLVTTCGGGQGWHVNPRSSRVQAEVILSRVDVQCAPFSSLLGLAWPCFRQPALLAAAHLFRLTSVTNRPHQVAQPTARGGSHSRNLLRHF